VRACSVLVVCACLYLCVFACACFCVWCARMCVCLCVLGSHLSFSLGERQLICLARAVVDWKSQTARKDQREKSDCEKGAEGKRVRLAGIVRNVRLGGKNQTEREMSDL
jgi:hypothetical protein